MADRPILFSAPMIRALLAGTKTQTRRALKFQPAPGISIVRKTIRPIDAEPHHSFERRSVYGNYAGELDIKIKRGDRLWVREAWRTLQKWDELKPSYLGDDISKITFEADPENRNKLWAFGKLRPSMFMPRWGSRLTLIVTDVRVERLQDISEIDAIGEGVQRWNSLIPYGVGLGDGSVAGGTTAAGAYLTLWDHINGAGSWEANPWVAAYTFTVHHVNIDQIAQVAA